jgi:hypothetical protein
MLLQLYPKGNGIQYSLSGRMGATQVFFYHMSNAPLVFNGFGNLGGSQKHVQSGGEEKHTHCP